MADAATWLQTSLVAPIAAAKRTLQGGVPTDILVSPDVADAISKALHAIGEPSSAGFKADEISESPIVGDVGRLICGLQVWRDQRIAANTAEVWACTHRNLDNRPQLRSGVAVVPIDYA